VGLLSNISGKEAAVIFRKFGYILDHQTGSQLKNNFSPFTTIMSDIVIKIENLGKK